MFILGMALSWVPGHFPLMDRYLNGTIQIILLKMTFALAILRTGIWALALDQRPGRRNSLAEEPSKADGGGSKRLSKYVGKEILDFK